MTNEPQWLRLGREAAAKALYESWCPLRTDNGFPDGSLSWEQIAHAERQRYLDAGDAACLAYHDSTLKSARLAVDRLVHPESEEER